VVGVFYVCLCECGVEVIVVVYEYCVGFELCVEVFGGCEIVCLD
jgi:hypothetical protein